MSIEIANTKHTGKRIHQVLAFDYDDANIEWAKSL